METGTERAETGTAGVERCEATFIWNGIAVTALNLGRQAGTWDQLMERFAYLVEEARQRGPDSMVVNLYGEIVPYHESLEEYQIDADVIFVRDDGWMLGAPANMERIASEREPKRWILKLNTWERAPLDW